MVYSTFNKYDAIPDEILIKIFSYITHNNLNDLYNSLLVSKRWNKLATFALYNTLHFRNVNQRSNFFKGLLTNNEDQFVIEKRDKCLDISLLEREFCLNEKINKQIDKQNNDIMDIDECDEIIINDNPIPMKYITSIKSINFGLSPNENKEMNEDGTFNNGTEWNQHCVNSSLNLISIYCPNIVSLNLSGCQYYDYVLCELLENCKNIMYLDVSYSSIKQMGLLAILDSVSRTENPLPLREINLSGIFRFWRLYRESRFLPNLIRKAKDLKKVIILDCPDILDEIIEECKSIRDNVTIVYETKTPINEIFMKDCSITVKSDSSVTLASNNEIYV
ncbi:hypothetical protein BCR32DRAFT_287077 [Anaeromyces robustus]|uniref:F-box domain-containing protein n=1 Tax=Anaeromyces robustus TaxID=1754192 RepID=A0A1Y1VTX2_9FUNG|nr:hypothetical protein BCR32DRAFT_287077 [Anaeromyces robustus]|eukprot:ORX64465.1 hypothetical protein BCR32DRAFT_287077 [Anaeromyces robustus]